MRSDIVAAELLALTNLKDALLAQMHLIIPIVAVFIISYEVLRFTIGFFQGLLNAESNVSAPDYQGETDIYDGDGNLLQRKISFRAGD